MAGEIDVKRIVCLGFARQDNLSRQVVGKELLAGDVIGGWVRVVTGHKSEGVPTKDDALLDAETRAYFDPDVSYWKQEVAFGSGVGHVMDVPVVGSAPYHCQKENFLMPAGYKIEPIGSWDRGVGFDCFEDGWADVLFLDGYSSWSGRHDRVPADLAELIGYSLLFIKVEGLIFYVSLPEHGYPYGRVRGEFRYNRQLYRLWVTHSETEAKYLGGDGGLVGDAYLTISLVPPEANGEWVDDYSYKVIAGVIELPRQRPMKVLPSR